MNYKFFGGAVLKDKEFEAIKNKRPCFFLGANTGNGFVNGFEECYKPEKGEKLYIVKGGPGTGKSTFMKRLTISLEAKGIESELYFCSSDPNSLDGVRFPSLGVSLADGTAPHILEPKMLGVTEEIVYLGEFLNSEKLNAKEIIPLYKENTLYHKKASRYLGAASRLLDDSYALVCNSVNMDKVEQTALRLCREFFPDKGKRGTQTKRFLSGFTPNGYVLLEESLTRFAQTIFAVEDEYGAVSSVILSFVRQYALQAGYNVITCPCAMSPHRKTDHIIVPELGLAFCTTNWFMPITVDTSRRIHARRFWDALHLAEYKNRLRFNRRAAEELLDGAYANLKEAKSVHDSLENHYIQAMDFQGVSTRLTKLEEILLNRK